MMAQHIAAHQTRSLRCSSRPDRNTLEHAFALGGAKGSAFPSFCKARGMRTSGGQRSKARSVIVNTASNKTGTLSQEEECRLLVGVDVEALESRRVKFKKLKAICKRVGCKLNITGEQMVLSLLEKLERCSQPTVEEGTGWWQAESPDNFMDVHSLAELDQAMKRTQEQNTLLVVEFYKQDCVACRMMYPKVLKIAAQYPEVQFVKVDTANTPEIIRPLGIDLVPFFHMYQGSSGRVAAFSCNLMQIRRLKDSLVVHAAPRSNLTCDWPMPQSWPWFGEGYGERPAEIRKRIARFLKSRAKAQH
mmetsp:Transcript_7777/g.15898  ORF Transcript_7777/g.15898 Transcript_7777/m.15898 type:complete len:304 (+) Transcript_7777:169-1080(+)